MSRSLPDLPILSPDDVKRARQRHRYGLAPLLGIAGLVVVVAWVGWFAWGVWSMRHVWANVYTLNDAERPEAERIAAAGALAEDPAVTPRQRWDLCLDRRLPIAARYRLAESLDERAIAADPGAYALAVARSEGWPVWLRLALVRPLAYGADRYALSQAPLAELRANPDPAIALWAAYAQAVGRDQAEARVRIEQAGSSSEDNAGLARHLQDALAAAPRSPARRAHLDAATFWLRENHPAVQSVFAPEGERR